MRRLNLHSLGGGQLSGSKEIAMNYKVLMSTSASALGVLAAPGAFAADLPVRGPAPAPVFAAPLLTWTGFYVGVNGGGIFSDTQERYHVGVDSCRAIDEAACFGNNNSGALLGLTLGYNMQSGNIVYGIEGDIAAVFGSDFTNTALPGLTIDSKQEMKGLATLRARLGYSTGSALFYITGGFAAVNMKNAFLPASGYVGSKSSWDWAPVAGAGVEYMFTRNWSAKIEGLYIWNTSNSVVDPAGPKGYRTKADHFVVRAGINYRFGGSAAPVVARY